MWRKAKEWAAAVVMELTGASWVAALLLQVVSGRLGDLLAAAVAGGWKYATLYVTLVTSSVVVYWLVADVGLVKGLTMALANNALKVVIVAAHGAVWAWMRSGSKAKA